MDMNELLHDPRLWVTVAFIVFVALAYKKISTLFLKTLDDRSALIKSELERTHALRLEAEEVLATYKKKQAEFHKEAELILKQARLDADQLAAHADKELQAALDARMKQALIKIEQEEIRAIQDVREHIVEMSLAVARSLLTDYANKTLSGDSVKRALSDIERKIH
jgi:F-type H+-transporting ATPase subunit b